MIIRRTPIGKVTRKWDHNLIVQYWINPHIFSVHVFSAERFDEFDILANSYMFYLAGYETTSSTLSFCLYELALNQSIQDELRAELEEAYEKNNRKLTYNMLHELKYLDAVISGTICSIKFSSTQPILLKDNNFLNCLYSFINFRLST